MTEKAIFAAGCFWGVEETFRSIKGVLNTRVGYTGGTMENPTYKDVCSERTHHAEAVEVEFDPAQVSYDALLDAFWSSHDPTTPNRQGPDIGEQYRSAIFYLDERQRSAAETSKARAQSSDRFRGRDIVTQIVPASVFWPAEEYHQQYLEKRGLKHCRIC
ncbi:MAG: peptide-methionine (S)-S-oxide reductase MsrA [Thermoplasmata archaeon]|nr:peptide-methionine (S)-S-oxide reductase MsrA [Thermoplasmata archaeon]